MLSPHTLAQDCPGNIPLLLNELDSGGSNEWVELYNLSDCPEPLDHYVLEVQDVEGDRASQGLDKSVVISAQKGKTVPPRGYLVVCIDCKTDLPAADFCDVCLRFDSSELEGLDRDGGVVSLYWQPPCQTPVPEIRKLCSVRFPPLPSSTSYGNKGIPSNCDQDWCILDTQTPGGPNWPNSACIPDLRRVVINEISSSESQDSSRCLYTDCPDWVELSWLGPEPVDLGGYRLINRGKTLVIPPGVVLNENNRYTLIILSSATVRNSAWPPDALHAQFQIKAKGDSLELVSPDGQDWDRLSFPALRPGEFYARAPDGGDFSVVAQATPKSPNPPPPANRSPSCKIITYYPLGAQAPLVGARSIRNDLRVLPGDWLRVICQAADPDEEFSPENGLDLSSLELWIKEEGFPDRTFPLLPGKLLNCQELEEPGIFQRDFQIPARSTDLVIQAWVNDKRGLQVESQVLKFFVQVPQAVTLIEQLRINEIAANETDQSGDWVELFNPTSQPVLLSGVYLSDNILVTEERLIPEVIVPKRGFAIIWCDNKSGLIDGAPHLPFLLDKCRGEIYLFEYDALLDRKKVIDGVPFQKERRDKTLGRYPDGGPQFSLMESTPGSPNQVQSCFDSKTEDGAAVVINEICADNWNTVSDRRGSFGDYLELYNRGSQPVSLTGWSLADHVVLKNAERIWPFPEGLCLLPKRFLLVWCDADPCETQFLRGCEFQGELHASFNINHLRDFLFLFDPQRRPVSCLAVRYQARDIAVGRFPDGAEAFDFMEPTPGFANRPKGGKAAILPTRSCAAIEDLLGLGRNPCLPPPFFKRGNANGDKRCEVDIADAVFILLYLFAGGVASDCPDAADIDDSGALDVGDPIRLLNYLFLRGALPSPPFPERGIDPTEDSLKLCIEMTCE
ncbi:MAG: lamin tail domain-containing protein [Planctomycetes bacterium]|nr:lamin tail domain-containing protein [Planctomycetota bacterium]